MYKLVVEKKEIRDWMRKNPLPVSVALKESHLGEIMNHPDAKNLFFQIVTDQDGTENVEFLYNLVEFYLKKKSRSRL